MERRHFCTEKDGGPTMLTLHVLSDWHQHPVLALRVSGTTQMSATVKIGARIALVPTAVRTLSRPCQFHLSTVATKPIRYRANPLVNNYTEISFDFMHDLTFIKCGIQVN
jgi:hypothetical protein